ncbi:MAG: conserved exported protein of unknown function [Nitrospira sp.]|nr:MAG: conserved exported protein of unknown function [Nitrospira sp.]
MRILMSGLSTNILALLLPLTLLSCSGGSDATPGEIQQPSVQGPPPSAGLIWRHGNTLWRGQTDGSGQILLADEPAEITATVVSGTNVVYETPRVPPVFNGNDIWAVKTDGSDRHLVVHDPTHEIQLKDVIEPWVLYTYELHASAVPSSPSLASILLNGDSSSTLVAATGQGDLLHGPIYARQAGGRALIEFEGNYFSLLPDGSDLRQLTAYPPLIVPGNDPFTALLGIRGVVADKAIYATVRSPSSSTSPEGMPKLFTVPVRGGPTVKLGAGLKLESFGAVVDTRVAYNQCKLVALANLDIVPDQCDVFSVLSDGQGRVALTTTPYINYVQGAVGGQVIIRSSQRGGATDRLFSIPVSGGVETPLLLLSAHDDFVVGFVADRIILRRATGLWSLKADGSGLIQLTSNGFDWFSGSTGSFACFARGAFSQPDLWCVPADGSGAATSVALEAYFVSGL